MNDKHITITDACERGFRLTDTEEDGIGRLVTYEISLEAILDCAPPDELAEIAADALDWVEAHEAGEDVAPRDAPPPRLMEPPGG